MMRAKLADVARAAGVSPATASRVLTGSAPVRPQTRTEVEAAVARLGYVRNRTRHTVPRRTGSVALVVCEDNARVFAEPFFLSVLRSISVVLAARGIQLVLLMAHSPRDYQMLARYLRSGHVDGAALVSMHGGRTFDPDSLGLPVAMVGRPLDDDRESSYVDADNVSGARQAVRYLADHGRSMIATIAGPPDMSPGVDRLRGYRAAMADAGLSDRGLIMYGDFGMVSAEHAVYRLLDRRPTLDAVFAASDLMAAGALRALRRAGRRVPDDVAVIGFDDSPIAICTSPQMTTVRQPIKEMGELLATELLSLIARSGREPFRVVLDTTLVIRQSA
jgi:DNA-binding LacI/PurR family transcriptional regulator